MILNTKTNVYGDRNVNHLDLTITHCTCIVHVSHKS